VQFKIGLCQLSVTADKERNIAHARKAIEEAAAKGAKLVMLPVSFPIELCIFIAKLNYTPW
jgi:predicted amidohydrolase